MMRSAISLLSALLVPSAAAAPLAAMMPTAEDHGTMFWAQGFPKVVPGAPWQRVIQTGHFAFVLDTESLAVPHLGSVARSASWRELPPAELALEIVVDGKRYRGAGAKPWTRFSGPRLIEAGRFFQRGDVTDLVFRSQEGETLPVAARLETAAWPDRLGLVLIADTEGELGVTLSQGERAVDRGQSGARTGSGHLRGPRPGEPCPGECRGPSRHL